MLYNNRITGTLALALIIGLTLAITPPTGSHAQSQSTASRQRRASDAASPSTTTTTATPSSSAENAARSAPTPQPTPKEDDATTVQDDEVVRVETDLTNILFTAADRQKRFVTTLKQEDIRILEDGRPQEIFTFSRQTDLPLSLAILVDTSASEERTLPEEKDAASAFINSVIRPNKDEAAVVSFTGEATLELGLTSNVSRVRRALDKVEYVPPSGTDYIIRGNIPSTPPISGTNQALAGSTAIWDALWITSDEVLSQTSDKTRRAIILLTDGVDTSSQKKLNDAVERAVRADAVIYSIGIGAYGKIDEGSLRKVSERTGGRAFFPDGESELRAAFAQIQEELRSQYLIAYSPTNKAADGSFRRVEIEFANPELKKQNLKLTYRQGYFAKSNPSTLIPPPAKKRP